MGLDAITPAAKPASPAVLPGSDQAIHTCPMHAEVQQDHPGDCPKCGRALELKIGAAGQGDEESGELRDMTMRF